MTDEKPNCYRCKHRRSIPGNTHSACHHPAIAHVHMDKMASLLGILGGVGPIIPGDNPLNIEGNAHGIRSGWFTWPVNFDPVWLERCDGFEPISDE